MTGLQLETFSSWQRLENFQPPDKANKTFRPSSLSMLSSHIWLPILLHNIRSFNFPSIVYSLRSNRLELAHKKSKKKDKIKKLVNCLLTCTTPNRHQRKLSSRNLTKFKHHIELDDNEYEQDEKL